MVLESSFWPNPRRSVTYGRSFLSVSTGEWERRVVVEDRGVLWASKIVVETRVDSCCRGNFEAFLAELHGGLNCVNIYCFDYDAGGPWGSGRTLDDWGALMGSVTWEAGAHWDGGAAWRAMGGVVAAEPAATGARTLFLSGGFPGDRVICGNDRITVGGAVHIVKRAQRADADARFTVELFTPLRASVAAGAPIPLGGRFVVPMRLKNREAAENPTGPDRLPRFTLDLIQD